MQFDSIKQSFDVSFEYPVCFTRDVFDPANDLLRSTINRLEDAARHRVLVFVDEGVVADAPERLSHITTYFEAHRDVLDLVKPPHILPGGEAVKNDYRGIMEMVDTMLEYRMCRHSFVMVIGGGAVLDAVGFAASMVHRGLRTVRLPSTVLAQNDAGIGVKNGMNLHGGKNTVGSFHPPFAVINDFALLDTLPHEHWIGGVSEAFKVAMIKDAPFFHTLCRDASLYAQRDREAMEELIVRCASLHLDHIRSNGDPFEMGHSRPLDFGHWAAHKLESMSNYRVSHGAAVAVGLAIDAGYACRIQWISEAEHQMLLKGLCETGFPLWYPEMGQRSGDRLILLNGLDDFQEHLGGTLCVTVPQGVGRKREVHEIDAALMEQSILSLNPESTTVSSSQAT